MFSQRDRAAFGYAVGHGIHRRQQAGGGGGVEQIARTARQHAWNQDAGGEHVAEHMDAPVEVPIRVGGVLLTRAGDTGIRVVDVDWSELRFGGGNQRLDVGLSGDVGGDGEGADVSSDLGEFIGVEIGHHYAAGAGLFIRSGDGFTDAACRTSYDADFLARMHFQPHGYRNGLVDHATRWVKATGLVTAKPIVPSLPNGRLHRTIGGRQGETGG
jgi:hypothetical protein